MKSKQDIVSIVNEVNDALMSMPKIKFNFDRLWSSNFPSKAGVYFIFNNNELIYIGETANLKERMKEVKRTYNHSFRRKLGKYLNEGALIIKGKFTNDIELALNSHFTNNISFAYVALNFGRLEVEAHLIHKYKDDGILNSIGKRNKLDYDINS